MATESGRVRELNHMATRAAATSTRARTIHGQIARALAAGDAEVTRGRLVLLGPAGAAGAGAWADA
jgi:hypothetical protein